MPKRKRALKPIPDFKTEAEEREFWETHDTTEYVDWSDARFVTFPNLKPSTETISLRLTAPAKKGNVPYQSLLKVYLAERVASELRESAGSARRYSTRPTRRNSSRK